MSNYDYEKGSPKPLSEEQRKKIAEFYEADESSFGGISLPCPKCGASLNWNWINADNLFVHIEWHRRMQLQLHALQGHVWWGSKL